VFSIGTCDVCGKKNEVGVASLPFAPMSVAFCRSCLQAHAYPLWAIHANIEMLGGYEEAADWFKELGSFHDGEYIDGDKVKQLYEEKYGILAHK